MTTPNNKQPGSQPVWVIKIGSALLTGDGAGLDRDAICGWARQMAHLQKAGVRTVLVSSGAVAAGMQRMGWSERPHALYQLQAAAAIGQMGLVQLYESAFQEYGLHTAQILLTHEDLANRNRYLNARSTLREVLRLNVVPVVNENDSVAIDEIRFGDNDSLAAMVANLLEAERLVILTDQDGLFDADPRHNDKASLISEARAGDQALLSLAGGSGRFGRGGMLTKVQAAERAARSGADTYIVNGRSKDILVKLHDGESAGTRLVASSGRVAARKRWLAGHMQAAGELVIDDGAVKVLQAAGRSLLPVGVTEVHGRFSRGELVRCIDGNGKEIARGLVNYDSRDATQIIGRPSEHIESILGYVDEPEIIHRDNMIVL